MSNTVVTIETGLGCNNRCAHCPQPSIRAAGPMTQPSFQEIRQKIDTARAQGCSQLSFSGGEPTIRRDIAELVRYARASGFHRVSITTNGRMFAIRKFVDAMLRAGLTGVSVSLHGPDAATHEALTTVPGSFDQALAGMAALKEATIDKGIDFDITTITVLVPGNIDRLRETLLLAEQYGARLHIVQPFILSKEVLNRGSGFILGINEIVSGIRKALGDGLPDGRVKPYNIPPCLLQNMGADIEVQQYHLRTVREFDPVDGASAAGTVKGQFFRYAQCSECDAICPGLRVEHLSQSAMVRMILADIMSSRPFMLPRNSALSSIDLLGAPALECLLGELSRAGATEPVLYWGGIGLCDAEDMLRVCREGNVSRLILLARPPQLRPPDARVSIPGNIAEISRALKMLEPGVGPEPVVFLVLNSIYTDQCSFTRDEMMELLRTFQAAGGKKLILSAPEGIDPLLPAHSDALKKRIIDELPGLLDDLRTLGLETFLARTGDVLQEGREETLETKVARLVPPVNLHDDFLHHRFAAPENGWVMWSYPVWIHRSIRDVPGSC